MFVHSQFIRLSSLVFIIGVLVACGLGPKPGPPAVSLTITDTTILVGEVRNLTADASGSGTLKFKWTATGGSLSATDTASVDYTAPASPGSATVTVEVSGAGGTTLRSITFTVVEPTPPPAPTAILVTSTSTPVPATSTPLPTPTTVPSPIACNNLSVTGDVFPQLKNVDGQFPIYAGDDGVPRPEFLCQAVFDVVHSALLAIRIEFHSDGKAEGWWGIATPKGYDLTPLNVSEFCFWAYTEEQLQAFRLKLKDTSKVERGVDIIVNKVKDWTQICTPLAEFSALGVDLKRLDNVNLGFSKETASATVWVDDFEFRK